MPTRRRRPLAAALLPATLLVTAAACGGGGGDDGDDVASLSGDDAGAEGATTDTTLSDEELEDVLLDWTQCMRDEGIDVPDPTVDEDGNLVLGGGPGGAGGGPPSEGGEGQPTEGFDRDAVEDASEACGDPPEGAFGGDAGADNEDFQESALAFSECMREEGITDFPDPDLSNMGPGGGGTPEEGEGGGPFGDAVDMDDPEVQAAMEACQAELGDLGQPGGDDNGGADESAEDA